MENRELILQDMYACYKKVVSFLMRKGLNYEDAQDAAQDTYIEAISYIDSLHNHDCMESWLFAIARRVASKYFKKNRKRKDYEDSIEDYELDKSLALAISDEDKVDDALGISQKEILYNNILKLEEKEQKVIALYYVCNYGYREIADLLKLNHSTVRSISRRAKEKLRRLMEGDEIENTV